jgi:hypothetical protein
VHDGRRAYLQKARYYLTFRPTAVHCHRSPSHLLLRQQGLEHPQLLSDRGHTSSGGIESDLADPPGLRQEAKEPSDIGHGCGTYPQWVKSESYLDADPTPQPRA